MDAAINERVPATSSSDPASLTELILDGCKIKKIDEGAARQLAQFQNLETLCLNQTGLVSFSDFPSLPNLKILELQDNFLQGNGNAWHCLAEKLPSLEELSLAGNKILKVEHLQPLANMKNLRMLDLELNPIAELSEYRSSLFAMIPSLEVVDDHDKEGQNLAEDEEDDEDDEDGDGENVPNLEQEKSALQQFYEGSLEDEDEELEEEFAPHSGDDDDSSLDDEDDEEESDGDEDDDMETGGSVNDGGGLKRSAAGAEINLEGARRAKKQQLGCETSTMMTDEG